jgi:hypothetical protein
VSLAEQGVEVVAFFIVQSDDIMFWSAHSMVPPCKVSRRDDTPQKQSGQLLAKLVSSFTSDTQSVPRVSPIGSTLGLTQLSTAIREQTVSSSSREAMSNCVSPTYRTTSANRRAEVYKSVNKPDLLDKVPYANRANRACATLAVPLAKQGEPQGIG